MQGARLGIFAVFLVFLVACSSDETIQKQEKSNQNEAVQIEQNDEKTELSDSNLPLPVEDSDAKNEEISPNLSIAQNLYLAKCARCHGKNAELKTENARVIKELSNAEITERLNALSKEQNHALNKEQIATLSEFLTRSVK